MLIQYLLYDHDKSRHPAVICADKGCPLPTPSFHASPVSLQPPCAMRVRPGDRVAILLPNSIEFAAAFFGSVTAGAIAVPMDIFLKKDDLLTILDTLKPRIVVTNHSLLRKIRSDLKETSACLVEYDGKLAVDFVECGAGERAGRGEISGEEGFPRTDPGSDAVIILSSGTTGIPKGVRLSHRAVLCNIVMHLKSLNLELEDDIRGLQVLPMNFSYGLIASFLSILYMGGTAVLLPYLEPTLVFENLTRHRINLFMGTPTIFKYLIENSGPDLSRTDQWLRHVTRGDQCKRYTLELIKSRFPSARIYLTYGLSEAGPRVSTLAPERSATIPNSVGLPLGGVDVIIMDDYGNICAPLVPGEIVVKSPSLMNGYFGDPERTKRVIRDGLCHTGDIGYMDREGFLYCVGRKDRQFKFGGRYVNPHLIEQCIASHPLVKEVSVEKKDTERSEVISARIKADFLDDDLLPELKRLCLQHMPAYMIPGEFHFEEQDHYMYKGKKFVAVKQHIP